MAITPVVDDRGPLLEAAVYLTDGTRLVLGLRWDDLWNGGVLVTPGRVAAAERSGAPVAPEEALGMAAERLEPGDRVWLPGSRIAAVVLRQAGGPRRPVGFAAG